MKLTCLGSQWGHTKWSRDIASMDGSRYLWSVGDAWVPVTFEARDVYEEIPDHGTNYVARDRRPFLRTADGLAVPIPARVGASVRLKKAP